MKRLATNQALAAVLDSCAAGLVRVIDTYDFFWTLPLRARYSWHRRSTGRHSAAQPISSK